MASSLEPNSRRPPRLEKGAVLRARTALVALKQRTVDTHREVEDVLALLDPALDAARLGAVIGRFHAFWQVTEDALDHWLAGGGPGPRVLADDLDWPRRHRAALLSADLVHLGATPGVAGRPAPPVPFTVLDEAALLGWLYVSEGATLGGAVLARHLGPRGLPIASFTPYAEGPGPMWLAYGERLQAWVEQDDEGRTGRVDAVAVAASEAFEALARWVAPLRQDEAA